MYTICSCMQAAAHKIMQAVGIKVQKHPRVYGGERHNNQGDVQVLFKHLEMLVLGKSRSATLKAKYTRTSHNRFINS